MEVIAFASGKGGTGKTLMASCLGYALIQAGHRVLMIDADPATDGLSLFLLGQRGTGQIKSFKEVNTFTGILRAFHDTKSLTYEPRRVNRTGPDSRGDHEALYQALISGRGLYGDTVFEGSSSDPAESVPVPAVPDLDQETFRSVVGKLVTEIKAAGQYDYVIIDTRGGFAFESTDVCALADSFIVVTEPDFTSFYQDRNLVKRINSAASQIGSHPLLRSVIVNKATESQQAGDEIDLTKVEESFRNALTQEFPLKFSDTHPIPVDIEALKAYKTQRIPYLAAPGSLFSFATLSAFSDILQIVTARWSDEQIKGWNALVGRVSQAVASRNKQVLAERDERERRDTELKELREKNTVLVERVAELKRDTERVEKLYERQFLAETAQVQKLEPVRSPFLVASILRNRWLMVFAIVVGLIPSLKLIYDFEQSRRNRAEDLITKAYNTSLPPALRLGYIRELTQTYDRKDFDSIDLKGANLGHFDLHGTSLRSATLSGAGLAGTALASADLSSADLQWSNLSGADLSHAQLRYANLQGADLTGTDLRGANLNGAAIELKQLQTAKTDNNTILPNGSNGPAINLPLSSPPSSLRPPSSRNTTREIVPVQPRAIPPK